MCGRVGVSKLFARKLLRKVVLARPREEARVAKAVLVGAKCCVERSSSESESLLCWSAERGLGDGGDGGWRLVVGGGGGVVEVDVIVSLVAGSKVIDGRP